MRRHKERIHCIRHIQVIHQLIARFTFIKELQANSLTSGWFNNTQCPTWFAEILAIYCFRGESDQSINPKIFSISWRYCDAAAFTLCWVKPQNWIDTVF